MNQKEFYEIAKGLDARTFFNNLEISLNGISSGASVHKTNALRGICRSTVGLIEEIYDSPITVLQYRQNHPDCYASASKKIVEAVNKFGVKI